MINPRNAIAAIHFRRSLEALERAADDVNFIGQVLTIADVCERALRDGGKLLLAGNGGSAADAQHIAGEFLSRLRFDRNPLPAVALTTDSSVLTAIGNDFHSDRGIERDLLLRRAAGNGARRKKPAKREKGAGACSRARPRAQPAH
jgi:phosphoheptose isomerase